ncbi:MAG TPA: hypothetical protein VLC74_11155 [Rhizomicrobium sp.]|nr:hypothetical protein [Rhizomicrobium sp.]
MGVAVIVGTAKGAAVLKSKDRKNWDMSFELRGWPVTASARDDGGRTYAAVNSPNFGVALFASDDFADWKQLEAAPRYRPEDRGNPEHHRLVAKMDFEGKLKGGGRFVDQIWTLHPAHGALYAGVSEAGLFVSRDRGDSWQPIDGFNEQPGRESWFPGFGGLGLHTILTDAKNPDRMWVGISAAGFFRSDDGGKTWTRKDESVHSFGGNCVHHVANNPEKASVLYRQEHFGVYRSEDGGDSWQVWEDGLPVTEMSTGHRCSFGFPLVHDRKSGASFVVPLDGDAYRFPRGGQLAVYRSTDGKTWHPLTNGLPANCFAGVLRGSMAGDQMDPGGLYFGTTAGAIYASDDLGESWREIASGLPRIMSVEAYAA